MRIRVPFAIIFFLLILLAGYLGFSSIHPPINDKVLHFFTFFLLTLTFYWILETTRRRAVNFTFVCITLIASTLSEILQPLANSTRPFDPLDILANVFGSLTALGLNGWYHKRMLSRKREKKNRYTALAIDDHDDPEGADDDADLDHGLDIERGDAEELSDLESPQSRPGGEEGTVASK
ncbi:hypothetical protein EV426DRAFT_110276 [Tirmania nivea]|nr:hypothetical protein EV426DRAFT_110276 [Tirmania nivea]